ncbi:hypothetical protein CY34DRAFT_799048 [Suillus luteus UH-Slu-Lm8-n1]|uniref:Uncharacterized protein n=1 Tax=Suillus luteus UH-Slu-Lm8-n1 TaxID=930992 RepID=A0A0D0B1A3_9AGAM|nr:hypothetical protein CY34DRAFT_799048 [Suillus luteus UH-Slu-Lm8-n1]
MAFLTSLISAQLAIIVKTPHLPINRECCADITWPGPSRVHRPPGHKTSNLPSGQGPGIVSD